MDYSAQSGFIYVLLAVFQYFTAFSVKVLHNKAL